MNAEMEYKKNVIETIKKVIVKFKEYEEALTPHEEKRSAEAVDLLTRVKDIAERHLTGKEEDDDTTSLLARTIVAATMATLVIKTADARQKMHDGIYVTMTKAMIEELLPNTAKENE